MGAVRTGTMAVAALAGYLAAAGTARADAIDGNWCHADGKRLSIEGPRIVTPGGTAMTGDYDRHGFAYVVPAGEPGAGRHMVMVLLDEDTMQMGEGSDRSLTPEKSETWHRCGAPVS